MTLPKFWTRRSSARKGKHAHTGRLLVNRLEDRTVPATIYALANNNQLLRFDSDSPQTAVTTPAITNLLETETLVGIDFRPRTGQLFASAVITGSANNAVIRTYSINLQNYFATFVGQTAAGLAGAGDVATGFDFNPTVDRIRIVNGNDENARLNPNNGALAGNDTDLTPGLTVDIIGVAYDRNFDRQSIASPSNNVIPTTLFAINRASSSLDIQGSADGTPVSPNAGVVTTVGPLGFSLNASADGGFDIGAAAGTGEAFAALTSAADNLTRLYSINLTTGAATAVGLIGSGSTQVRGIAIAPEGLLVAGVAAGTASQVRTFDAVTGSVQFNIAPFGGFAGGVRVASGDVTGDGVADIIAAAGAGGGPHVRVFDGLTGVQVSGLIGSYYAYASSFTGGVFVASGDVNADGFDDIITGAGAGGGPHVKVFDGRNGAEIRSFFAYNASFTGGVSVGAGDINNDALADVITGAGPGGGPHVRVFSSTDGSQLMSFYAYAASFTGGVDVAGGDVNGDGRADVITGAGAGGGPHVIAYSGMDGSVLSTFYAFSASYTGGVRVGTADTNGDGRLDILAAKANDDSQVRAFDGRTGTVHDDFLAFAGFSNGAFISGYRQ